MMNPIQWIRFADKPPDPIQEILLFDERLGQIGLGHLDNDSWMWESPGTYRIPVNNGWISHWMHLPDISSTEWIDASKELPKPKEGVLLYKPNCSNSFGIGYSEPSGNWSWNFWGNHSIPTDLSMNELDRIGKWMYLPALPSI